MRVLIESSTESEWVAQALERWGHDVVVVDPNYGLMYGQRPRGVKTDRRDAAALAEACRVGVYRRAHRVSAAQRARRRALRVREQLVGMRTQLINQVRAQLRQEGYRLGSGAAETTVSRLRRMELPPSLQDALAPLVAMLATVGVQLATCTAALTQAAQQERRPAWWIGSWRAGRQGRTRPRRSAGSSARRARPMSRTRTRCATWA
jgi:transposase